MVSVRLVTEIDRLLWEQFIQTSRIKHHAFAWRWREIISQTFGHKPYYLIASSDNTCRGILPLFLVKSPLFGLALISVPYLNAGGIIAVTQEASAALLHAAAELKAETGARYLELRSQHSFALPNSGLLERQHKVSAVLDLEPDAEMQFARFPAKLRSQVKRPLKAGMSSYTVRADSDFEKALTDFYNVFSSNMRDLGTPVYPRELFARTCAAFGRDCQITCVITPKGPAAAGITISSQQYTEIPWASSLRKYNSEAPNMLLYWETIKAACDAGSTHFDFGRSSRDSNTLKFKTQWGAKELDLHWYYLADNDQLPDINPRSPKYNLLVASWRRLPLALTNRLGPWLTRGLP